MLHGVCKLVHQRHHVTGLRRCHYDNYFVPANSVSSLHTARKMFIYLLFTYLLTHLFIIRWLRCLIHDQPARTLSARRPCRRVDSTVPAASKWIRHQDTPPSRSPVPTQSQWERAWSVVLTLHPMRRSCRSRPMRKSTLPHRRLPVFIHKTVICLTEKNADIQCYIYCGTSESLTSASINDLALTESKKDEIVRV